MNVEYSPGTFRCLAFNNAFFSHLLPPQKRFCMFVSYYIYFTFPPPSTFISNRNLDDASSLFQGYHIG